MANTFPISITERPERSYKTYLPHQQRVIEEADALFIKLQALKTFTIGSVYATLSDHQREQLSRQSVFMSSYLEVLDERIKEF